MTNVHVVILGLLCEQPLHGYEIKHIIEEHMADWTDIKFGSIYFALSKLSDNGFVQVLEEVQDGNRPARTVYEITDKGRSEFQTLLGGLWADNKRQLYPFDIALFFMGRLPREEARKCIEQRISSASRGLGYLARHRQMRESDRETPKQAAAIIGHTAVHLEAEFRWLEDLLEHLDEYY
jgi:DNA-binding PadR family transcriptional regulator